MLICMSAQAATYWWIGGATGDWDDAANWATGLEINNLTAQAAGDPVPGSAPSDIVNLISEATITVNSDVQISQLWIPNPNNQTDEFSVTITGNSLLTVSTKIETYRPTSDPGNNESTLVFNCNVTSSSMIMHSGGNITIEAGKTANITSIENWGGANPETLLTVNGTLQSTSINLSDVTTRKIEVSSTGKISTGTLTGSTGSVSNAGLIVTQDSPATGLITTSGSGTSTVAEAGAFVWTGDSSSDWTEDSNWLGGTAPTSANISAVIDIPKVSRLPVIPVGTTLSFATANLTIDTDANITVNGELSLTGTTSDFNLSKINANSGGTLTVAGTLTSSSEYDGENLTISCGALTTSSNLKCTKLSVSGQSTITGTTTIESTGTSGAGGTGGISFGGAINQTDSLTLKSIAAVTFGTDSSFANLTIATGTSVSTASDLTVKGNFTNNGNFSASTGTVTFTTGNSNENYADLDGAGTNSFKNIEIQRNINIKNDVTVNGDFTANRKESDTHMGDRNIRFANGKKLTVTGNIELKGQENSTGNWLTLSGINDSDTWELACNGTASIQNLNIKGGAASPTLQTINSSDSGGNSGFLFPGQLYKWVGGDSGYETEWNRPANWNPQTIPSAGASIEIQARALTSSPVLSDNLDIKTTISGTDYGTIVVDEGAFFDIAGYDLTLVSIINNGTLRLTGEQSITALMSNGTDSTIEYYGGTSTLNNLVWDVGSSTEKAYTNLTISRDVSISDKITVSGKTIINAGASLTNAENSFSSTGKIKIGDSSTSPSILAGDVTIYADDSITIDDNAYAQSFAAYCPVNIHDITTTETQTYHDNVTLTKSGNTTFTAQNTSSLYQTIDFKKNILISGADSKKLILNSNTTISNTAAIIEPDIQTNTGTNFTPSSGTTTFKGNLIFADNTVNTNSGTIILTGENATGSEIEIGGSNTLNELLIHNSAKITGSNQMAAFTVNSTDGTTGLGGKTITFTAATTQTISGTLTLKGSSASSRLRLRSSSNGSQWKISCTSSDINFVDLKDAENESSDFLFALNSYDNGNNTKWNFPGMEYEWTGSATISGKENDWNTATNWSPASIPGKGSKITIPAGKTNYPLLEDAVNLNYDTTYPGSIEIENGASFDLAGKNLTVGAITNNGKVRLTGAGTITGTMSNGTNTDSTVEYYDTTSTLSTFVWDGGNTSTPAYNNLILLKPVDSTQNISVSGTVKIGNTDTSNPANNINAGSVTLNSDSPISLEDNVLADLLEFNCETKIKNIKVTDSVTFEKPVTLLSNSKITSATGDKIYFKDTLTGGSYNLTTETGNSKFDGIISGINTLTTDASVTFGGNVTVGTLDTKAATINCSNIETTTNGQTFDGAVTIQNIVTLKALSEELIHFKSTVSGNTTVALTIDTGNSQFDGDVNLGILSTKAATINCSNIETSSSGQTFDGTVTLQNSVTFKAPVNQLIYFKSNVSGSGAVDLTTDTGNSQFDGTITTIDNLITAARATFGNNINVGTISTQASTINCEQITTSGNQSSNDTITHGNNLTLIANTSGKEIDFANDISKGYCIIVGLVT